MNKIKSLRFTLLWGCFICCLSLSAQQRKELHIFHTNDVHSRLEPIEVNHSDTAQANKAGAVRRATFLKEMRRKYPDMLLFDAGDFSQGTPYYNMFKGEAEISLMNCMRYDAAVIGNHEFDFGLENMARLFRLADFPIVCTNYDVRGTVLQGLVKPYVIMKRNGLKIGVLGVSPRLEGLVQQANCEGIVYKNPLEAVNETAALLKEKEHCDVVICLSHLGWKGANGDEGLIAATRHVDVVLGGHSHSYFEAPLYYKNLDGVEIPLQHMGKNARFVGYMVLTFEKASNVDGK